MEILKRCMKNKKFVFSIFVLVPLIFIVLFGPMLAPNDPLAMNTANALPRSSSRNPVGTDEIGLGSGPR